jgi:2'-5' RNA ligase
MRYLIAHMIKGEIAYRLRSLSNELSDVFSVEYVTATIEPHLTLKAPFELSPNTIGKLEAFMSDFAARTSSAPIVYKGIGHFSKRVVFVDVVPSREATALAAHLICQLRQFNWMSFSKTDAEKHMHATLVYAPKRPLCDEMKAYAEGEFPDMHSRIDTISILRQEKEVWKLHAEYILTA